MKWLQSIRVYATAQNVYTFQYYKGYNPDFAQTRPFEPGYDPGSFPTPRTLMMGLQARF
ncbi:hypothetical protein [Pedobacter sp. NJ-S-72]